MSGSGDSGYSGGYQDFQISCEKLVIDTQLSSPKEEVINKIRVGQVLDVGIKKEADKSLVVVLVGSAVAGGVASPQIHQLRECIEKGTFYEARVQSIKDGQVRVRISIKMA